MVSREIRGMNKKMLNKISLIMENNLVKTIFSKWFTKL